ncbi:hypothetical protein ACFVS2_20215 [Brevibacillus sp. NPDC058079]|uniref:hypothetical protein n=1 Tax=Brevibacillus sp. NPDC058079 TaxID=3346330 RepID=UPI0036E8A76A
MKTIFWFLEGIDKRKITLKHPKDIYVGKEVRNDHLEWTDADGNVLNERSYIVIRIPKSKGLKPPAFDMDWSRRISTGYLMNELDECFEILFYDRITFGWYADELEKMKMFRVSQQIVPDFEGFGEMFPCYLNPRGMWQWTFNIVLGFIQLPFVIYKERKETRDTQFNQPNI